jgi:hypothetical protein
LTIVYFTNNVGTKEAAMKRVEKENTVVVLTRKSIDTMSRDGGSGRWRLVRNRARHCDYAICTRNGKHPKVEGKEPHRSAFLIAKVEDVVPSADKVGRFVIRFSEYAKVNLPDIWKKGNRNPVTYTNIEELGIDPLTLPWEKMTPRTESSTSISHGVLPSAGKREGSFSLTILEAKKALAVTFGVPPGAIEITIRG